MSRFTIVLVAVALVVAACGVDREAADGVVLDGETSETDQTIDPTTTDPAAGEADGGETTSPLDAPPTTALGPTTTAPAGDVALTALFDDGMSLEILHGDLNAVVVPSVENQEFIDLLYGGLPPAGFTAGLLGERLVSDALVLEIGELGEEVTDTDLADSRDRLLVQVATLFPEAADPTAEAQRFYDEVPYLQFLAVYQAGQDVLTTVAAEQAPAGPDVPCVSHILLDTEAEATAALARLDAGEEFAALAVELSIGPSGPTGGALGCAQSSSYVGPFAAAVDGAELGEFVGPVQTDFGFHVLVVEAYEEAPPPDGRTLAIERLRDRLQTAMIEVDERIGQWDPTQLAIVPAQS